MLIDSPVLSLEAAAAVACRKILTFITSYLFYQYIRIFFWRVLVGFVALDGFL